MLRFLFIGAVALCLSGCESAGDFLQPVVDGAWPFSDSQAVPADATADDAHCTALAHAREADARENGFDDDDMLEQIRDATYADCAEWDKEHPQPRAE